MKSDDQNDRCVTLVREVLLSNFGWLPDSLGIIKQRFFKIKRWQFCVVNQISYRNIRQTIKLNVSSATGANAERGAVINLTTGVVMVGYSNECYACLTLIGTRFLVAARINRQRKNIHGEKKAYYSHGAKLNKKNM